MKQFDESRRAGEALGQYTSRLCAAILRISASLELDIVLREIVENARELTGAQYGIITTIDEAGKAEDFVISGISAEGRQQMLAWSDGLRLFEHFRDLSGVVRLTDLPAYVGSMGYSEDLIPSKTFQCTPMYHLGKQVGIFFLGGKQHELEFTNEDEEILVIFASQAAIVIANAHAHGKEQRARADLEALIDTSPVGVIIFDIRTSNPALFNQEAQRLVKGIQVPGYTEEQLLDIVTCRRSDGREVTFNDFLATLDSGNFEAVRAETVQLSVGDDRSVKVLINATPIYSANGKSIDSLVVTMQDLGPLEELERSRTEFLGMVSHELRAPLSSIKGSAATVLVNPATLGRDEMLQFFRIVNEQADHMQSLISDLLDAGRIDTGTLSIFPEPWAVSDLVERARTLFLSGGSRHAVRINLPPELPRVMVDSQRIIQVLNNLFSNAAKNSPLGSPINVTAFQKDMCVAISVLDEGRGISPELLPHLFEKYVGFQKNAERGITGFGLGLAICKGLIETLGGRIWAESAGVGMGARFTFTVPVVEEAIAVGAALREPARGEVNSPASQTRILVVDDDLRTLRYVQDILTSARYSPIVTSDHRELPRIIKAKKPGLVLLDLVFPDINGITLMESVSELADQPVIILSGYGKDETIARALEIGAVDYIVKPFSPTELTARIRAALRRSAEPASCVLKDLEIHYDQHRVTLAGRTIHLTPTEYRLLRLLSLNAGNVVTYDKLIRLMWGDQSISHAGYVRTFVKKLRHKLGDDPAQPTYILNVRGIGYKVCEPNSHDGPAPFSRTVSSWS